MSGEDRHPVEDDGAQVIVREDGVKKDFRVSQLDSG